MNRLSDYPFFQDAFTIPSSVRGESAMRAWLANLPPLPTIAGHRPSEALYHNSTVNRRRVVRCVLYFPCHCEVCGWPITRDGTLCRQASVADTQVRIYLCHNCADDARDVEDNYYDRRRP